MHIHLSLLSGETRVTGATGAPYGLGKRAAQFFAGVLTHLPAICAFSTPSVSSYYRLTPNRWAPVYADIGTQDRGVALRVAPVFLTSPEDPAKEEVANAGGNHEHYDHGHYS